MLSFGSEKPDKILPITRYKLMSCNTLSRRISNHDMRSMHSKKRLKIKRILGYWVLDLQLRLILMPDRSYYKMIWATLKLKLKDSEMICRLNLRKSEISLLLSSTEKEMVSTLVHWQPSVQSNLKYQTEIGTWKLQNFISKTNTSESSKPDSIPSTKTTSCSELQLMRLITGYTTEAQSSKSWLNSGSNEWLIPWSKTDLREIILHSEQVWEELRLS